MTKLIRERLGKVAGVLAALLFLWPVVVCAQDAQAPDAAPAAPGSGGRQRRQSQDDTGARPVFGRIAAIQDGAIRITRPDGSETTVKITAQTEFRRDREAAKLKDFKVGDGVLVRGTENPDFSVTAQMVAGRTGNGAGNGPNRQNPVGTLGVDFVVGEVKALDPPSLTVMRTDNVKQTFELNEDTSLRRGRDSVTMADLQVGDHVFARGALEQKQFVPKTVVVIEPEQWKRMQELGFTSEAAGRATQQGHGQGQGQGQHRQNQQGQTGQTNGDSGAGGNNAGGNVPDGTAGTAPSKPTEPPN